MPWRGACFEMKHGHQQAQLLFEGRRVAASQPYAPPWLLKKSARTQWRNSRQVVSPSDASLVPERHPLPCLSTALPRQEESGLLQGAPCQGFGPCGWIFHLLLGAPGWLLGAGLGLRLWKSHKIETQTSLPHKPVSARG